MTFTAITTKKDVREAYVALRDDLTKNAASAVVAVGWPGGHGKFTVHWHGKQGLWVLLQTNRLTNRYWCAYGTQSPRDHKYVNITCEINPPKSGRNGRCAGVFIRDSSGAVHIGHSGKVGGGGTGVGRTAFLDFYGKALKEITWPDGTTTSAIVIGKLSSPTLIAALAQFVYTVERFKDRAKRQEIGKLLEEDAARAEREGNFDPKNVKESRDKTIRQVNLRRGQPEFRRKLLRAYGGRCAVCGSDCTDTLEAAHILAYGGDGTNHVQNGLLLRSDLHILFDLGKIGIDPDTRKIIVARSLMETVYGKLNGRRLRLPTNQSQWPNKKVLQEHLNRWALR